MEATRRALVVGATGFVGRALVPRLAQSGAAVRGLVRSRRRSSQLLPPGVDCVEGEVVEGAGLGPALSGVDVAYYLVHSMGTRSGTRNFADADRAAATNFAHAARDAGLGRIIYLGGLGDDSSVVSQHLASRREVGEILRASGVPVTQLRAGIIVGAGGSSFEMVVQLVEKLPVMICPRWIDTLSQPIALGDLVRYLVDCGRDDRTRGQTYDVGGPDVMPYWQILMRVGAAVGRRPCLVLLPRFTPALSAHWVGYITDVSPDLARPVIDGMSSEAICRENRLREILPAPLTTFDDALRDALVERKRLLGPRPLVGGHIARSFEGRVFRLVRAPAERSLRRADPDPGADDGHRSR